VIGSDPGRLPTGVTLDNWQAAPNLHWSFQHVADVVPTAPISRGIGPVAELPYAPSSISDVVVPQRRGEANGHDQSTVGGVMQSTFTDAWVLLHRGVVLTEEYFGTMEPAAPHLLMSVSKSLVGSVAGALWAAGGLDLEAPLTTYVPALDASGYAGATVRHVLDMRSGIEFSEDYLNPDADVRVLEEAIDWAPRRSAAVPATMCDFLLTLRQKTPHGGPFEYRSCESDVLGWVCEAAGGARMPDLMSQLLWSQLGAEFDANIGVDSVGTGLFDGGISAALRDLARFGAMILGEGTSLTGAQVLPPAWIADTFGGGPDSREAFAASPTQMFMPGGMYRNQYWFPSADPDVALCLGIHGQMIYINRRAEVVAAKLSSWPTPQDARMLFATVDAFDSAANALSL
jgi:CubicO group peptidase (beta-lactamase class C family)